MTLDILITKAEQAMDVLDAFDPFDDGDLWIARVDAEDVDKAVNELRKAIAKARESES